MTERLPAAHDEVWWLLACCGMFSPIWIDRQAIDSRVSASRGTWTMLEWVKCVQLELSLSHQRRWLTFWTMRMMSQVRIRWFRRYWNSNYLRFFVGHGWHAWDDLFDKQWLKPIVWRNSIRKLPISTIKTAVTAKVIGLDESHFCVKFCQIFDSISLEIMFKSCIDLVQWG